MKNRCAADTKFAALVDQRLKSVPAADTVVLAQVDTNQLAGVAQTSSSVEVDCRIR